MPNSFPSSKNPLCLWTTLTAAPVRVVLRVWALTDKYWDTRFEIREAIKKAFDAEGIEIPYDHMDVNLVNSEK